MLKSRDEQDAEERTQTLEGEIVAAIHTLLFVAGEGGALELLPADILPENGKPHEALAIEAITDTINADLPDKKKHDVKWVGKQVRKLELRTKEVLRRASPVFKKSAVVYDRMRLSFLFALYSLPVPTGFSSEQSEQHDNTNADNSLRCSDEKQTGSPNESHPNSLNPSNINYLPDCSDCSDEKAGKEREGLNESVPNAPTEHCVTPVSVPAFVALDTETEPFDKKRGITPRNAKMIGLALCHDGQQADYETDSAAWPSSWPRRDINSSWRIGRKWSYASWRISAAPPRCWTPTTARRKPTCTR